MPNDRHYAILVGIGDYPHMVCGELFGPANDVALFSDWLTDPAGGNMPQQNIVKFVSPDPRHDPAPARYPPTEQDIWDALKNLIMAPDGNLISRLDGRLYLFFSGHGFSSFAEDLSHAALYTANADRLQPSNVCGTRMAKWCADAALFGEIILVMDCCRDQEISKTAQVVPYERMHVATADQVKQFEVYAVSYDGKAQERTFEDGKVYGLLTYALVEALRRCPLVQTSAGLARTCGSVKNFMEASWGSLVRTERVESPEFVLPKKGDIGITTSPPEQVTRSIRFAPSLVEPALLEVFDGTGASVYKAFLDPTAGQLRLGDKVTGAAEAFDGATVEILSPAEVVEVVVTSASNVKYPKLLTLEQRDVEFDI